MKSKVEYINLLVTSSTILSGTICAIWSSMFPNNYENLALFPWVYLLVYIACLKKIRKTNCPITAYGIIIMQWLRFVLLPLVILLTKDNVGFSYISATEQSYHTASILVVYEFIITSVMASIILRESHSNLMRINKDLEIAGSRNVYTVYLIVIVTIIVFTSNRWSIINFLLIPLSSKGRIGDAKTLISVLLQQLFVVGQYILIILTIDKCKRIYNKKARRGYYYLALLLACLCLGIIIGERRTTQIYLGILCIMIINRYFPQYRTRTILAISSAAFLVILGMSIYKFLYAFQYDSYIEALINSNIDLHWFARYLQAYFFGLENVAATIDFSHHFSIRLSGLAYDLLRSTFGISFLMKGKGVLTSELYNTYIYGVQTSTGHVISSVGYGYIYFGCLLSPLIAMFNIVVSKFLELKMRKAEYAENYFLYGMMLLRFSTNLFVNCSPLISTTTMLLFNFGLIYAASKIIAKTL